MCAYIRVSLYPLAAAPGAAAAAVLCMNVCNGKCCGKLLTTSLVPVSRERSTGRDEF